MKQVRYIVWQAKDEFKYRWKGETRSIPWDLTRQRELYTLLARWEEMRPATDKLIAGSEENIDEEL